MAAIMMLAIADPERGSLDEKFRCDCDHYFTRRIFDMKIEIFDTDTIGWFDASELSGEAVMSRLQHYVHERHECPTCSCCSLEDESVHVDLSEEAARWMCSICLEIWSDEEDAHDCCDGT